MKTFSSATQAGFLSGLLVSTAVYIASSPDEVRLWGGKGLLTIDGADFVGAGDAGLVEVTGNALGGAEQNITASLSGVDPAVIPLIDQESAYRAPVLVYRLFFDKSGQTLNDAEIYASGRVDQLQLGDGEDGKSVITIMVEGAARGMGYGGGRVRSDLDQQAIATGDDGMKSVSYAGQKTANWGGKVPLAAGQLAAATNNS